MTAFQCGNGIFGCGKRVEAQAYNAGIQACTSCVGKAAARWRVRPADLTFVQAAYIAAKGSTNRMVNGYPEPTAAEVEAYLAKLPVERVRWVPPIPLVAPRDSQLPEHDRAAA